MNSLKIVGDEVLIFLNLLRAKQLGLDIVLSDSILLLLLT